MAGILRAGPSLWFSGQVKPGGIPRIDWSHPLANKLVSYWWSLDGGSTYIDLVTGDYTKKGTGTKNTLPVSGTSRVGQAPSFAAVTSFCESVNLATVQSWTAPYSFAAGWYQIGATTGTTSAWWGIADASGNDPFFIYQNGGPTVGFSYGNSGSAFSFTFASSTFYVGVGAATGTSAQSSWINGVAQTAGTATSAYSGANLRYVFGDSTADSNSNTIHPNSIIFFGAAWSGRALTQQEAVQLYTDPYAMLMPPEGEMPALLSPAAAVFPPGVMPGNPIFELTTGTKFPASFEQPQLRGWIGSYNLNLIGKDRLPTGQYPDWTVQDLPASPPPLHQQRTWTWAYNLNLIGKDRLPAGVFPGNGPYDLTASQVRPPDQVQLRTWTASLNLNLIGQVQLPVGDQAYDLTAGQRPPDQVQLRTWTWSYNLNLIGKDQLPPGDQVYDRPQLALPAAPTWIQASVTYLTPVAVQRPFTQSDWPLPLAPWRPDFTWTQRNANLTPAAMPGAVDWDLPTPPPALLQQSTFPTLAQRAAPPAQLPPGDQLYDRPALPPVPAATTWIDYLRFIVVPFNQTDWPLTPAPLQPIRTWTASYNLDLIGQDQLPPGEQATDLAPRAPLRSQDLLTWIQSINLTLITAPPNIFAQARQSDWPVPKGPEPDWRRSWTWSYNLNLIGKDQLPVGDQVTDLAPRDFPRLLQTWIQQTNLALLSQPPVLPLNQTDWPVPKAPQQPAQSWTTSYNLNLIGKDRLPTRQQDWPLPGGHTIPTLLQTWASSRAILFPAPVFPPGDQFFDRPQLRRDTPPDFYFIGARYPIIPPPIVIIGASYRLLSSHYLYNVYYLPNTVVTEGAEVPFGWVPTLAVDPLNAAAAAAYYAAGPRHTAYEDMNTYSTMYRPVYPDVPVNTPVTHWRQVPGTGLYELTGLGAGNPPVGGD